MTVQRNGLADNRRIGRKTPAPIMMTDDYDWMRARNLIVFFRNRSAEQGIDAQHGKKAAGNPLRASHFSLPIQRDIDAQIRPKRADAASSSCCIRAFSKKAWEKPSRDWPGGTSPRS